jgi:hypothetical protein
MALWMPQNGIFQTGRDFESGRRDPKEVQDWTDDNQNVGCFLVRSGIKKEFYDRQFGLRLFV